METPHPFAHAPRSGEQQRSGKAHAVAAVPLAMAMMWNTGNVGPVTQALADQFHVSLTEIGLISGTMFFLGGIAASLTGNAIAKRIGVGRGARLACLICVAANIGMAVTPAFAGFYPARLAAGFGAGLGLTLGPMIARTLGGRRSVGYYGAGVMLGLAGALGIGGVLQDVGVDWRWGFVLSAAVAVLPILLLPASLPLDTPGKYTSRRLGQLLRTPALWRLALLLAGILGVPMVMGAWLIHYLSADGRVATAVAGLLSFVLFAMSAFARVVGGRIGARVPAPLLIALPPLLAAGGLAAIAVDDRTFVAAVAVVAMGIGFSLPYAATVEQVAVRFPNDKLAAYAFCTLWLRLVPLVTIPIVGSALDHGHGTAAWLALAAFVLVAGLINLLSDSAARPTLI